MIIAGVKLFNTRKLIFGGMKTNGPLTKEAFSAAKQIAAT
jgi:hypothetical protein